MKTTVKFVKTEYSCKDRVVTASVLAEANINDIKYQEYVTGIPEIYKMLEKKMDKYGRILFYAKASVKCHESDTFDYEHGRRLAYTKAQANIFGQVEQFYDNISAVVDKIFKPYISNCYWTKQSCNKHFEDLKNK